MKARIIGAVAWLALLGGVAAYAQAPDQGPPSQGAPPPGAPGPGMPPQGYGQGGPPPGYGQGGPGPGPMPQAGEPGAGRHMNLRERFEAANTTRDGRLTLQQAQAAGIRPLVRHFTEIDRDGKGYVTLEDLKQWRDARRAAHQQGGGGMAPPMPPQGAPPQGPAPGQTQQ